MNSTSAGEVGGSVPFVDDGSARVGFPGAPGWTTTGAGGVCCAQTRKENKLARMHAAASMQEHAILN